MKFIHAADIHLDSPLSGLSAYPDAPVELLRTATRDAFENLVSEALAAQVDFMVIAGDLYDGGWRDFNTGIFFARQMGRLNQAGIAVYLLFGNHDAENEMTRKLVMPANVHCFPSNKAATFQLPDLRVALHGRSFKDAATTDNLALAYPAPVPGWLNIGVLHTALEGNSAHASYAPCSLAELQARGYQYWALGHVHAHQVWRLGDTTVAFPGNLQGRHVRETGPKGALLVTAEGADIVALEQLAVDVLRWHALEVDLAEVSTLAAAVQAVGRGLQALVAQSPGQRPLAVRVTVSGASPAHGLLFGLEAQLREEVLAQAAAIAPGRLWVEKVRLATTALALPGPAGGGVDNTMADLQQLLARAGHDAAFLGVLQQDLMQLVGRLPLELLASLPQLERLRADSGKRAGVGAQVSAEVSEEVAALVRSTAPALLAQLASAE